MNSYTTYLISTTTIAEKTIELNFKRPESFCFQAGQHINIKLPQLLYDDKKGPRRTFTIVSSPADSVLRIATRLSESGFKKTIIDLPPDTELEFMGPMGNMVYNADKPSVFIAGGIGITPFKSIITELLENNAFNKQVRLIYANRKQDTAAFHSFFNEIENNAFIYNPIMTDDDTWDGEKVKVDYDYLKKKIDNINDNVFYLCGPPQMVQELTGTLNNLGVEKENILSESFFGY